MHWLSQASYFVVIVIFTDSDFKCFNCISITSSFAIWNAFLTLSSHSKANIFSQLEKLREERNFYYFSQIHNLWIAKELWFNYILGGGDFLRKFANDFSKELVHHGVISRDEFDVFRYGLEVILSVGSFCLMAIVICSLFGVIDCMIIFLLSFPKMVHFY